MGRSSVLLEPSAPAAVFTNCAGHCFLLLKFSFFSPLFSFLIVFPADLMPFLIILSDILCFDARVFEEAYSLTRRTVVPDVASEGTLLLSILLSLLNPISTD